MLKSLRLFALYYSRIGTAMKPGSNRLRASDLHNERNPQCLHCILPLHPSMSLIAFDMTKTPAGDLADL